MIHENIPASSFAPAPAAVDPIQIGVAVELLDDPSIQLSQLESGNITKFNEQGRPELLSVVQPGTELVVGRAGGTQKDLLLSRKHFSVGVGLAGEIVVVDNGSTNGTKLATTVPGSIAESLDDFKQWSIASHDAKNLIVEEKIDTMQTAIEATLDQDLHTDIEHFMQAALDLVAAAKETASKYPELINGITEIVTQNSLNGHTIPDRMGKGGRDDDYRKTARFIELYAADPGLAEMIAERSVAGFHSSGSGSLISVLRHGLLSAAEARRTDDIAVVTGERTFSIEGGQKSVSFGDWGEPDTISRYLVGSDGPLTVEKLEGFKIEMQHATNESHKSWGADHPYSRNSLMGVSDLEKQIKFLTDNPDSAEAKLMMANFPVAYGVDVSDYEQVETVVSVSPEERKNPTKDRLIKRVPSEIPGEFIIKAKRIEASKIAVIAVPKQYVDYTEQLLAHFGHTKARVISLELITKL